MKTSRIVGIVAAVILIVLSSCNFNKTICGTWDVVQIQNNGTDLEIVENSYVKIESFGKKLNLSGYSGVNTFSGKAKYVKDRIECPYVASTKMMGPTNDQMFEDLFLEILTNNTTVIVNDDSLVISNDDAFIKFQRNYK